MSDIVRVLQLTDLHLTGKAGEALLGIDTQASFERVLRGAFAGAVPDLVLLTGDLAHHPEPSVYARVIDTLAHFHRGRWLWTPGNHDLAAPMAETLATFGIEAVRVRHATVGAWAFYMLDTHADDQTGGRLDDGEMAGLDAFLAASHAQHLMIAGHHPLATVGAPWLDADRVEDADRLLLRLEDDGRIRLFVSGHVHQRSESWHDGVRLLTTPSTCFQFAPGSESFTTDTRPPGWRWFELSSDGSYRTDVEWATL
jgi:3',5'-cyclic-AMP phosphodiesterase